jgi:hypothetical protein
MTVTINGTTGYTGPIGAIGDLSTTGNTTLGDASGDTLTINGSTTTFTQGTANGVAYLNGSKVLTTGSALTFDGTTFATTAVASFAAGSAAAPAITRTGDTNTGIFFPAADTIAFAEGGVEAMRLDASGNLGIGTTSPAARLNVVDTQYALNAGGAAAFIRQSSAAGNNGLVVDVTSTPGAYVQDWRIANSSVVRIDASGNLGVGTASPATPLHIYTGIQEQLRLGRNATGSSGYITFFANNSSSAQVQYAGILGDVASSTAGSHGGNLLFYTTGSGTSSERARITSGGAFVVGGTSAVNSAVITATKSGSSMGISSYSGSNNNTINTVATSSGSGGGLVVVSGVSFGSGQSFSRLYLAGVKVPGGATSVFSSAIASVGEAGVSFSFTESGGFVTCTASGLPTGAWTVMFLNC